MRWLVISLLPMGEGLGKRVRRVGDSGKALSPTLSQRERELSALLQIRLELTGENQ
jgi:hypothetical protein